MPNLLERLQVVLVRPQGPLNVGSVARLCGNFGCGLSLVQPVADLASKEAIMMAHPSEELLSAAPVFATLGEALRGTSLAVATSGQISDATEAPWLSVERARLLLPSPGEKVALVFGTERTGLSIDEAAQCPRIMRLPTPGPAASLNLSHAVAVTLTLFNSAAEVAAASTAPEFRASTTSRRALMESVLTRLEARGVFRGDARRREAFRPRLEELSDKMDVSERDLEVLEDLLRMLSEPREPTPSVTK